jgi:hypothetical protein
MKKYKEGKGKRSKGRRRMRRMKIVIDTKDGRNIESGPKHTLSLP